MAEKDFAVVGHSYPRKDGIARVTGQEKHACRWQLQGVACRSALSGLIPVDEVV